MGLPFLWFCNNPAQRRSGVQAAQGCWDTQARVEAIEVQGPWVFTMASPDMSSSLSCTAHACPFIPGFHLADWPLQVA